MIIKGILFGMCASVFIADVLAVFTLLIVGARIDNILIYVMFFSVLGMAFIGLRKEGADLKRINKYFRDED